MIPWIPPPFSFLLFFSIRNIEYVRTNNTELLFFSHLIAPSSFSSCPAALHTTSSRYVRGRETGGLHVAFNFSFPTLYLLIFSGPFELDSYIYIYHDNQVSLQRSSASGFASTDHARRFVPFGRPLWIASLPVVRKISGLGYLPLKYPWTLLVQVNTGILTRVQIVYYADVLCTQVKVPNVSSSPADQQLQTHRLRHLTQPSSPAPAPVLVQLLLLPQLA